MAVIMVFSFIIWEAEGMVGDTRAVRKIQGDANIIKAALNSQSEDIFLLANSA